MRKMLFYQSFHQYKRRDFMRKLLVGLTLLLAVMMVLSACQGALPAPAEEGSAAPAEEEAAPVEEEAVVAAEPTPIVNAFGDCDDPLILWHGLTGADGAVFAEMLEQFTVETPEVCLRSEGIPWDLFFQKYPTAVAAGTPPDIVIFHAAEVNQMASEGLMMPMDDIFYNDGPYGKDDFNAVLIDQITIEGETMAVPFDNHGWLLWYNRRLIEEADLDPDNLPKDGLEFIEWGQKLTVDVNGKHPNEEGFDPDNVEVWAMYPTWTRYSFPTSLWQFGGGVINEDGTEAILGSPESIAAIQFWHDMMYKYHIAAPWESYSTWSGDYYQPQRLVFMWEGTWLGGFFRDNPDLVEVTGVSFVNSLAPDGNQAVKFDSHIFSIPTGVDQDGIDKAKKLMIYLLENGAYWTNAGQVPALLSVQQSDEVQAVESVAVAAEQFNAIGRTDMAHKSFIEIQTAYETAIGNALSNPNEPVDQALKDGAVQIQAILDRP
jgi:ABC-type glycerol-3-phosphate transport system substrate-binding protein